MSQLLAGLSWPIVERIGLPWGEVSPHGLGIALGFVLAAYLFRAIARDRLLRQDGLAVDVDEVAQEIVVRAALGAMVGARLAFVLTHLDVFAAEPLAVLRLTDGGFSFLGGLAGALVLCIPWLHRRGFDGVAVLDAGAAPVALGLLCGRLGDLVIGDHLGAPTDGPLGWRCSANLYDRAAGTFGRVAPSPYPVGATPTQGCYDVPVLQTALVDGVVAVVVLLVTLVMVRRGARRGLIAATWVLTYAPLRILGDVLREDRRFGGLTGSQWAMLVAGSLALTWVARTRERDRVPVS